MTAAMRILCLALCFPVFVSLSSHPENPDPKVAGEPPCWADDDYWMNEGAGLPITSKAAILKTFLLPVNLEMPEADAAIRHAHGDFRFMAIGGFGVTVPQVDRMAEDELTCKYGTRFMEGTSDAIEGGEHAELMAAFAKYAGAYNLEMRRLLGHAK